MSLGRWISEDPSGFVDGYNLYAYVNSRATVAVDPLGLKLYVCYRRGWRGTIFGSGGFAVHTYLWDTWQQRSCGRGNQSGAKLPPETTAGQFRTAKALNMSSCHVALMPTSKHSARLSFRLSMIVITSWKTV